MQVSAPAPSEPAPVRAAAPVAAPAPVVAVKPEPPAPQPAPVVVAAAKPEPAPAPFPPPVAAKIEAPLPALVTASKPDVPAPALSFAPIAAKAEPAAAPVASPARVAAAEPAPAPARASAPAAKPQHRSGWIIQVGAFPAEQEAKKRLSSAADEGGQAAHQGRSVHRNGREGRHHSLPRALCRSRQGLGRSRLQVSQAQRRRMRHHQELTSSVKQDSRVARSRPMRRVKEFSDGGAKARPWLRSREPQDTSTPLDRDAVSS